MPIEKTERESLSHISNDPRSIAEFMAGNEGELKVTAVQQMKRSEKDLKAERFRLIEDRILEQSMTVVADAAYFREIDPGESIPPKQWVDELGYDEAKKRLRIANAAWLGMKEAPYGLKMAQTTMTAIVKARTSEKTNERPLNMQVIVVKNELKLNSVEVAE